MELSLLAVSESFTSPRVGKVKERVGVWADNSYIYGKWGISNSRVVNE